MSAPLSAPQSAPLSASKIAYVGLGANLERTDTSVREAREAGRLPATSATPTHPADTLRAALGRLATLRDTRLIAWSSLYRSDPVDAAGPDYFNAVARLDTRLDAAALLAGLLDIEQSFGRQRPYRNAPRTLDLDLLLYGDDILDEPGLQVPHPRMTGRAFVLRPLAELDPTLRIPGRARVADHLPGVSSQAISRIGPIDVMLGP